MMQQEVRGCGSIATLADIVDTTQARSVFLVASQRSFVRSGVAEVLRSTRVICRMERFQDFHVNPTIEDIERGVALLERSESDVVVAVGGGSAIDVAKAVNVLAHQEHDPRSCLAALPVMRPTSRPLIAVPTTSGTGAEATQFAAVYIDGVKHSLDHASLIPKYVILDPQLTFSLPPMVTATTGMDALCQAVESYWSVRSTEESKSYSRGALAMLVERIVPAVRNPAPADRAQMLYGANLSGKAINIARTTACHAMSYPMTARFQIPHGHAVALTLAAMIAYNAEASENDVADARGSAYVRRTIQEVIAMLGCTDVEEGAQRVTSLMRAVGLAPTFSELYLDADAVEEVVRNEANLDRMRNNPRKLTDLAVRSIFHELRGVHAL